MWSGYAESDSESANEEVIRIRNLFPDRRYDGVKDSFHTSGHADVQTLREVCQTVKPRIGVIPIHKDAYSGGYPFSISGDIRSVPS